MAEQPKFLLGTGSFSRRAIVDEMGLSYNVIKADIDERALGDRSSSHGAEGLVVLLANAKADAIMAKLPPEQRGPVLITADQVSASRHT